MIGTPYYLYKYQKSTTMVGLLSQALANLTSAEAQIINLTGLPSGAVPVQNDSADVINKIVPQVTQLQSLIYNFIQKALPQLDAVETAVSGNISIDQLRADLLIVHNEADELNPKIESLSTEITKESDHINGYANILVGVDSDLNGKITVLNAQIGSAQGRANAAQKKYYYLIGLAPLALFGFAAMLAAAAAAIALYSKIKTEIDTYQSTVSSLSIQISRLNMMKSAINQLAADFLNLTSKITNVQNSLGFLSGDITNSINDITNDANRLHIRIFVQTAMTEIMTLQRDAS